MLIQPENSVIAQFNTGSCICSNTDPVAKAIKIFCRRLHPSFGFCTANIDAAFNRNQFCNPGFALSGIQ